MTTQVVVVHVGGNRLADVITMQKSQDEKPDQEIRRQTLGTGDSMKEYIHTHQYVVVYEHDPRLTGK
jgi:hypothetical protein